MSIDGQRKVAEEIAVRLERESESSGLRVALRDVRLAVHS